MLALPQHSRQPGNGQLVMGSERIDTVCLSLIQTDVYLSGSHV